MFVKKVKHKGKMIETIKHGITGEIFLSYASLAKTFDFTTHQSRHYREKLINLDLLMERKTITKETNRRVYILKLDNLVPALSLIKPKDEKQLDTVKSMRKTLKTAIKQSLKNLRPADIQKMIDESTFKNHFNKITNSCYLTEYNRVNYNLYGLKTEPKIGIKKNISKVWQRKKRRCYENFELIDLKLKSDINKLEKRKEKTFTNKMKKLAVKQEVELVKKEVEINELKPEFHYTIPMQYIKSYNHELKAVITKGGTAKIVKKKTFTDWKTNMKKVLTLSNVNMKYLIQEQIVSKALKQKKKLKLDLQVKLHMNQPWKVPDGDNYIKPFQDVLCELLGVNDTIIKINSMEIILVGSYKEQGYKFGLRLEK